MKGSKAAITNASASTEPTTQPSTEPARREETSATPGPVESAGEKLDELLRAQRAVSPIAQALGPPDSFGSATSNTLQRCSYYATSKSGSPPQPGSEEPLSGQTGSSKDVPLSEVLSQLRAQQASNQELMGAVGDLQDATVRLEARVSDLETHWSHHQQVVPEYYELTPREDPTADWYNDAEGQGA